MFITAGNRCLRQLGASVRPISIHPPFLLGGRDSSAPTYSLLNPISEATGIGSLGPAITLCLRTLKARPGALPGASFFLCAEIV
jgi:hypothetical protein